MRYIFCMVGCYTQYMGFMDAGVGASPCYLVAMVLIGSRSCRYVITDDNLLYVADATYNRSVAWCVFYRCYSEQAEPHIVENFDSQQFTRGAMFNVYVSYVSDVGITRYKTVLSHQHQFSLREPIKRSRNISQAHP